MRKKDLIHYQIHTDLAIEKKRSCNESYITLAFEDLSDIDSQKNLTRKFAKALKKMMNALEIKLEDKCLIIGLGNPNSTPDALGPCIVAEILVTAHLFNLASLIVHQRYRNVAALAPGVTSETGIETFKMIEALVKKTKPDFLIVIDALVAKSLKRLNHVIQLTTSGITPGSGLGGGDKGINQKTLGLPVIAIGVPTVVGANVIVKDTLDYLVDQFPNDNNLKKFDKMSENELINLLDNILKPLSYSLMVTPKDIDFMVKKLALIIAKGINETLHQKR